MCTIVRSRSVKKTLAISNRYDSFFKENIVLLEKLRHALAVGPFLKGLLFDACSV